MNNSWLIFQFILATGITDTHKEAGGMTFRFHRTWAHLSLWFAKKKSDFKMWLEQSATMTTTVPLWTFFGCFIIELCDLTLPVLSVTLTKGFYYFYIYCEFFFVFFFNHGSCWQSLCLGVWLSLALWYKITSHQGSSVCHRACWDVSCFTEPCSTPV